MYLEVNAAPTRNPFNYAEVIVIQYYRSCALIVFLRHLEFSDTRYPLRAIVHKFVRTKSTILYSVAVASIYNVLLNLEVEQHNQNQFWQIEN